MADRKYRVHLVYDVAGWAYHRRALGLQKHAPDDFDVSIGAWENFGRCVGKYMESHDLVYNCEYSGAEFAQRHINKIRSKGQKGFVHVISYNADSNRRRERWAPIITICDYVIANNRNVFDHFERPERSCNISNGVDPEVFFPTTPICDRDDAAMWCGSTSPKKTKCYAEVIKPIVERFEADPESIPFVPKFRPIDEIDFNPVVQGRERVYRSEEQNDWYNASKVVLCTSTSEGTPNFILEGMAAGCVPVTTMCGNTYEWGKPGKNCVVIPVKSVDGTIRGIKEGIDRCEELSAAAMDAMKEWHYERRAQYFYSLFRALIERGPKGVKPFTWQECEPEDIENG